jgi:uncharacterized repeat protein (TIGR03803 family)
MCSKSSVGMRGLFAIFFAISLLKATSAAAQQEGVLHSFNNNNRDGTMPEAALVVDALGNLYGATYYGGDGTCTDNGSAVGCGTAFKLTPTGSGQWTKQTLHNFHDNGWDGYNPLGGLVMDAAGNLYGTTLSGGAGSCTDGNGVVIGCGAVFELTPTASGPWTIKILYSFQNNGIDGAGPYAGVIFDQTGNLYGTSIGGGSNEYGTVFELSPKAIGAWNEKILFNFDPAFGEEPAGGLVFDTVGNLYGTALYGGSYSNGVAFELSPQGDGSWVEAVLHSFGGTGDGIVPWNTLVLDSAGNLYGTTNLGGAFGFEGGTAFELTPAGSGDWTETILYSFGGSSTDGAGPAGGLTFDSAGNLYGATRAGGTTGFGTAYQLIPSSNGTWTENQLHSFGSAKDGSVPGAGLVIGSNGQLYGTTERGGYYGFGTVFEIVP